MPACRNLQTYACPVCEKKGFISFNERETHLIHIHGHNNSKSAAKHRCCKCQRAFSRQSMMQRHLLANKCSPPITDKIGKIGKISPAKLKIISLAKQAVANGMFFFCEICRKMRRVKGEARLDRVAKCVANHMSYCNKKRLSDIAAVEAVAAATTAGPSHPSTSSFGQPQNSLKTKKNAKKKIVVSTALNRYNWVRRESLAITSNPRFSEEEKNRRLAVMHRLSQTISRHGAYGSSLTPQALATAAAKCIPTAKPSVFSQTVECPFCHKNRSAFTSDSVFGVHVAFCKERKGKLAMATRGKVCFKCKQKFVSQFRYIHHVGVCTKKRGPTPATICTICDKRCKSHREAMLHMYAMHSDVLRSGLDRDVHGAHLVGDVVNPFRCRFCDEKFKTADQERRHRGEKHALQLGNFSPILETGDGIFLHLRDDFRQREVPLVLDSPEKIFQAVVDDILKILTYYILERGRLNCFWAATPKCSKYVLNDAGDPVTYDSTPNIGGFHSRKSQHFTIDSIPLLREMLETFILEQLAFRHDNLSLSGSGALMTDCLYFDLFIIMLQQPAEVAVSDIPVVLNPSGAGGGDGQSHLHPNDGARNKRAKQTFQIRRERELKDASTQLGYLYLESIDQRLVNAGDIYSETCFVDSLCLNMVNRKHLNKPHNGGIFLGERVEAPQRVGDNDDDNEEEIPCARSQSKRESLACSSHLGIDIQSPIAMMSECEKLELYARAKRIREEFFQYKDIIEKTSGMRMPKIDSFLNRNSAANINVRVFSVGDIASNQPSRKIRSKGRSTRGLIPLFQSQGLKSDIETDNTRESVQTRRDRDEIAEEEEKEAATPTYNIFLLLHRTGNGQFHYSLINGFQRLFQEHIIYAEMRQEFIKSERRRGEKKPKYRIAANHLSQICREVSTRAMDVCCPNCTHVFNRESHLERHYHRLCAPQRASKIEYRVKNEATTFKDYSRQRPSELFACADFETQAIPLDQVGQPDVGNEKPVDRMEIAKDLEGVVNAMMLSRSIFGTRVATFLNKLKAENGELSEECRQNLVDLSTGFIREDDLFDPIFAYVAQQNQAFFKANKAELFTEQDLKQPPETQEQQQQQQPQRLLQEVLDLQPDGASTQSASAAAAAAEATSMSTKQRHDKAMGKCKKWKERHAHGLSKYRWIAKSLNDFSLPSLARVIEKVQLVGSLENADKSMQAQHHRSKSLFPKKAPCTAKSSPSTTSEDVIDNAVFFDENGSQLLANDVRECQSTTNQHVPVCFAIALIHPKTERGKCFPHFWFW